MIKIKFPWDIEEEEKEEKIIKFDWDKPTVIPTQFGIGAKAVGEATLPKPTAPVGVSQRMRDIGEPPKEFELEAPLAKLPETGKKIIQMLGGLQGFKATEPETYKRINDISKVINEQPDKLSRIAKAHELLTGEPIEQSLKEMGKPTLQPWEKTGFTYKVGVGEIEFVKLPKKFDQAQGLVQQAMQFSTSGKVGDVMRTVAQDVVLGYLVTVGLKGLYQSGLRVEDTWVSGKKLETAMRRAQKAYIVETGKFKATLSNSDLTIVKAVQRISRITGIEAGKIVGVKVPQQVFLGQAGKITNIVKIIQNAGKMTPETINLSKDLSPSAVTQVAAQLAPALANAFLKAVEKPEIFEVGEKYVGKAYRAETFIPEHGEEIVAKMKTAKEKLDYDYGTTGNYTFKEAEKVAENVGVDLSKVPKEDVMWVAPKLEIAQKYGEAKEIKLPKDTIVLAKDEEGGFLILEDSEKYIEKVERVPVEEPEKLELEPTPEEIRKVFMDKEHLDTTVKEREFFLSKFGKLFTETKAAEDTLVKQKFNEMNMMVEYEEDEVFKLAFGKEKMRVPETTKTEWMEGLGKNRYMQIFRVDKNLQYPDEVASNLGISENELREQIIERIRTAPREVTLESAKQALIDEGNAIFLQVGAQMDAYRILLDEIEGGEYSFDTPKNIKRLNAKISALKSDSKKLMAQYEEKITALQKEGIEKRFEELKKVTEAEKRVEVEIGVKKGVKEVFAARRLKGLPKEEYKKGNRLMGQIHKVVHQRGLTDKAFTALKQKYGYSPHLSTATKRMSIPQLEAVLKAVNRARPKVIGHKTVIKLKTENKIQSLKENLMDKLQMSEEKYQEVLKDVGVYKEPKYIDGKHFITETKGKDIIYRLIDEANILRSTLPYDKAVEAHPVIKKFIDREKAIIGRYRDRTMKDPREWNSMRVYAQKGEEITGAPVYRLYQDLIDVSLENKEKLGLFIREFEPNKKLMKDLEALKRVTDYVGSKSTLKDKPEYPKNITAEEVELAKKVEDMLIDYRARARTQKFLDNVDHPEKMPQYIEFKKEIDKAKDIYESKGYDDLVEYMKTQVWGIIRNGYDPDQVWSPKIRLYKPDPQTFGKHNIKVRTDIEYHEQDRNIIERLFTYKKSMDNLVEMRPKVRAFITLMDQNLDRFEDPKRVQEVIEVFLRELKGYNKPEGLVERILNRAYAQAMQVIIMPSPVMFGRNCLQNLAFGYDKTIIIDPRNKKLSEGRIKYLNTYISQLQSMKVDWFMIGEKPLGGRIGTFLIKMVNKVGIYPYSDEGNRHLGFWGKINQVDRGFKGIDANSTEKQISNAMKGAKFDDIERTERIMALEILAKDGYEDMAKYVSRCYVADTEFQYNRAERSPMEMGRGKWLSNLMLFPRSYWEMLLKMGNKFKTGNPRQKARAFKVLVSIIVGGLIVGEGYKKVTGRRQNPYNPLKLLAYEPGGLAIGTVEAFSDVITNTILVLNGDERAATTLATAIPRLSDMMIPFYDYTLRAIEATVPMTYRGQHVNKRIDVLALRVLRKLATDRMRELGWNVKGYKPSAKGYYVERNFYQKLQYIIAGAGVDIGIKEKLRGKPVPSVKFDWEKKIEPKKVIKFDWD